GCGVVPPGGRTRRAGLRRQRRGRRAGPIALERGPDVNPTSALDNLVSARDAILEAGANPFLVDGTLLGAVREGGFIAHDLDLDLGVSIEQHTPDIERRMGQAGFRLSKRRGELE